VKILGFTDWIRNFFVGTNTINLANAHYELLADHYFRKLAVESCIDLIAKTITRCEFQTFQDGREYRGENYYLLNVAPNQNQNSSEFIHAMVNRLYMNNECLVVMQDNRLYIADSFTKVEYAMKDNRYDDVSVGNFTFIKSFFESEVIHLTLNDENIMKTINGLYSSYGKLITSAMNIYKRSNAKRVVLKGDFLRPQTKEEQELIDDMFDNQLKSWFEADAAGAVFQLQKGFEMDDMSGSGKTGQSSQNSRDIRALADDIFDFVAMAFHIPRGLLKGDLAEIEKQTDNFLMFCINPLAELIADEFNKKMYTKQQYLSRTYLKLDTTRMKVLDVVSLATAFDKLFAIGVNTINDNLRLLGRETIDDDYANQRYVTKNYQTIETVNNEKGGEGHENA